MCRTPPAEVYQAHITSMLRSQLRRGDVVGLLAAGDEHLKPEMLAWYDTFLRPLLASKGAQLLLLRDALLQPMEGNTRSWQPCVDAPASCSWARGQCAFDPSATNLCWGLSTDRELSSGRAAPRVGWWPDTVLAEAIAYTRARNSSVLFLSTRDLFCTTSEHMSAMCGPTIAGTNVVGYCDGAHLNLAGSMYLWPYLCSAFLRFGLFDDIEVGQRDGHAGASPPAPRPLDLESVNVITY